MIDTFRFLKVSLAMVLAIVGPAFNIYLLLVVTVVLGFGVMASLRTGPTIEREELAEQDTSRREDSPAAYHGDWAGMSSELGIVR